MQKKFVALCLLANVSVMSMRANDKVEIRRRNGVKESVPKNDLNVACLTNGESELVALPFDYFKKNDTGDLKAHFSAQSSINFQDKDTSTKQVTVENFIRTVSREEATNKIKELCQSGSSASSTGLTLKPTARDIELLEATETKNATSVRAGFDYLYKNTSEPFLLSEKIRAGVIGVDYFLRYAGSYNSMSLMGGLLAKLAHVKGISTVVTFATTKAAPLAKLITATKAGAAAWTVANCTLSCMVAAPVVFGAICDIRQGGWAKWGSYCADRRSELPENIAQTILGNKPVLMARYVVAILWNNARSPFKGISDLMTKPVV